MGETSGSGYGAEYGIPIRDEHPESYFRELRNNFFLLKFYDAGTQDEKNSDPRSGKEKIWIRVPGINISDPQHGLWNGPDPDPAFHFHGDPDPDLDPDPSK
jgi:hypothetical protein